MSEEKNSNGTNALIHDTLVLTVITIVAGAVLGGVHHITAAPIAAQEQATKEAAQKEVFADAESFKDLDVDADKIASALADAGIDQTSVNSIAEADDASGSKVGYVIDATNNEGYGGEIELMVGISTGEDGLTINGISFLTLQETAGMGMKAQDPEFKDQFNGIALGDETQIQYSKSGKSAANEIDAISGCTVTTNAVTKAVNGALAAVESLEEG